MARTKQTARKSTGGRAPRKACVSVSLRSKKPPSVRSSRATKRSFRRRSRSRSPRSKNRSKSRSRSRSPGNESESDDDDAPLEIEYDLSSESVFYAHHFHSGCPTEEESKIFTPYVSVAADVDPIADHKEGESVTTDEWVALGFASKYDGKGMKKVGRPDLNLVFALDISGSMCGNFPGDVTYKSKIDVAKDCIKALLTKLKPDDRFGLVVFHHAASVVHPLTRWGDTNASKLRKQIDKIRANGGTNITRAMNSAEKMVSSVEESTDALSRIFFFTDMEVSQDDGVEFCKIIKSNSQKAIFATITGVGLDLGSKVIEDVSATAGCNYSNVRSNRSFQEFVDQEFSYTVTPIAYDINIKVASTDDGHAFKAGYGTPEVRNIVDGTKPVKLSTVFPCSQNGDGHSRSGLILFKVNPTKTKPIKLQISWDDLSGITHTSEHVLSTSGPNDEVKVEEGSDVVSYFPNLSIRKAVALIRYTEFYKGYLDARKAEDKPENIVKYEALRKKYSTFEKFFRSEIVAIKDPSLEEELKTLRDDAKTDGIELEKPEASSSASSSSSAGAPKADVVMQDASQSQSDAITCCICLDKPKNVLVLPCKHVCMCMECSVRVEKCPLCSKDIASKRKVYL